LSVEEIGLLHQSYIRISDRFKAIWTFHQYIQGVHKAFLGDLPKSPVDFQKLYERIREASTQISSSDSTRVRAVLAKIDEELDRISGELVLVDRALSPSLLRRFFEKIKSQDEKIVYNLVKFYIYSAEITGEALDKLDFLFTRLAEHYDAIAARFEVRQRGELIRLLEGFLAVRKGVVPPSPQELERARGRVAELAEAVERAESFESLSEKGTLDRIRSLKRGLGEHYFHPLVLADMIELSIATKNRFQTLYGQEEKMLIESSRKVAELEQGMENDPRLASPEMRGDLERFRRLKDAFDRGRENLNLKHEEIVALKGSILEILQKFDQSLETTDQTPVTDPFIVGIGSSLPSVFAPDPLISEPLARIFQTIEIIEEGTATGRQMYSKKLVELRLESWEVGAAKRLSSGVEPSDPATGDLWKLYLSAAALRNLMDEQAKAILGVADDEKGRGALLPIISRSLGRAKEYDEKFQWFVDEAMYTGHGQLLSELYRSKFRLLRCFSGLWLLYNKFSGTIPGL
jgi:hypothetical protein